MVKTRKAAYEVQTVNTARPVEKALPAEARLSWCRFFATGTDGWFGWELPWWCWLPHLGAWLG